MIPLVRVFAADPPWFCDDQLPGDGRGATKHYDAMPTKDICALKIPATEEDAILCLWRLSSMVQDALDVCSAWGFTPKSELTWIKLAAREHERRLDEEAQFGAGMGSKEAVDFFFQNVVKLHTGMGRYTRLRHETCIIATRGRGARLIESHSIPSVFFAPVREHSRKPDEFFKIIERLVKGPYVELFARRKRPGWICLGNAVGTRLRANMSPEQIGDGAR